MPGRGGSRKGRVYSRLPCSKCGKRYGSNVVRRHEAKCRGAAQ